MGNNQPCCEREDFAVITYSTWELSGEVKSAGRRQVEGQLEGLSGRNSDMNVVLFDNNEEKRQMSNHSTYRTLRNPVRSHVLQTLESLKLENLVILFEKMSHCEFMVPNSLDSLKYEK